MKTSRISRTLTTRALTRLAALWALAFAPAASRAEQFVLFDVTFTYTKQDADTSKPSKSHYYVKGAALNEKRPKDWTSPVDYRNGTVHIRAEVIEKPTGGEPTTWTLCYIPNRGKGNGYGCTGTGIYREKGVYEQDISMKKFWENDSIVWSEGIKQMDLVIKDDSGGRGHAHKRADSEKFFPTKMRITMVQVSAGSTYDPSLVPNLPREEGTEDAKAEKGAKGSDSTKSKEKTTPKAGTGPKDGSTPKSDAKAKEEKSAKPAPAQTKGAAAATGPAAKPDDECDACDESE